MFIEQSEDIAVKYQHIFVSPHLDDAIYACGGYLTILMQRGIKPLVITIFAGIPQADLEISPFAQSIHKKMGHYPPQEAMTLIKKRRQEDAAALTCIQGDYMWLNHPDAIYRGNPAQYTSSKELKGSIHPEDGQLQKQIMEDLLAVHEKSTNATWYFPLSIGGHVDHQLTFSVAEELVKHGTCIKFYEDFPYARIDGRLEARTKELLYRLQAEFIDISQTLTFRQRLAGIYTSQIMINFSNWFTLQKDMEEYTRKISPNGNTNVERYHAPSQKTPAIHPHA